MLPHLMLPLLRSKEAFLHFSPVIFSRQFGKVIDAHPESHTMINTVCNFNLKDLGLKVIVNGSATESLPKY